MPSRIRTWLLPRHASLLSTDRPARASRTWRWPGVIEALEGRALLTGSPLDPNFNGGQAIINSTNPQPAPTAATSLNSGSAVAVQTDGKIVVVGAINQPYNSPAIAPGLAVRRYNTNGTLDTTFGTNGEADITLPSGSYNTVFASAQVVIQTDGKIVFAADLSTVAYNPAPTFNTYTSLETVAVRLTPTGAPDSSFGTAGQTVISTMAANLQQVALQTDGKIVLGGTVTAAGAGTSTPTIDAAVTRLNTDGTIDSSFNGGNFQTLDATRFGAGSTFFPQSTIYGSLVLTPAQQIALIESGSGGQTGTGGYLVAEYNADGTLNTAFGTAGMASDDGTNNSFIDAAAVQPDGKILLGGNKLTRINANGSVDTTFANPTFTGSPIAVQPDGKIVTGTGGFRNSSTGSSIQGIGLVRYTAAGVTDGSFGLGGKSYTPITPAASLSTTSSLSAGTSAVAFTSGGQAVVVGTAFYSYSSPGFGSITTPRGSQLIVTQFKANMPVSGDYDGDGKSDIAAELSANALFAYRKSNGTGDSVQQFGQAGLGKSIPVSGDFDGDGKADVAIYIATLGEYAYRPSSGGADVIVPFGPAGIGASIPAPGDYFGTGVTAMAVYIPSQGNFAIRGPNGVGNELIPFGTRGIGASIPVPGDYDGDGKTDIAVYLTATGTFAYRPTSTLVYGTNGGTDLLAQFGPAGLGNSIPVPGDYNNYGVTDMAVYIPSQGAFAIRGTNGYQNRLVSFGVKGANGSIPAPGDYNGDGVTDLAVYIPSQNVFVYRPSTGAGDVAGGFGYVGAGGPDVIQQFGLGGTGQTIPATALPFSQTSGGSGNTSAVGANAAAVYIPLTEDLVNPTVKKKTSTTIR